MISLRVKLSRKTKKGLQNSWQHGVRKKKLRLLPLLPRPLRRPLGRLRRLQKLLLRLPGRLRRLPSADRMKLTS